MKKLLLALALVSMPVMAQDRVSKFDKNNDGVVDLGEINLNCNLNPKLFEKADKNNDGVLNNSEMRTAKEYLFKTCRKEKKD